MMLILLAFKISMARLDEMSVKIVCLRGSTICWMVYKDLPVVCLTKAGLLLCLVLVLWSQLFTKIFPVTVYSDTNAAENL